MGVFLILILLIRRRVNVLMRRRLGMSMRMCVVISRLGWWLLFGLVMLMGGLLWGWVLRLLFRVMVGIICVLLGCLGGLGW